MKKLACLIVLAFLVGVFFLLGGCDSVPKSELSMLVRDGDILLWGDGENAVSYNLSAVESLFYSPSGSNADAFVCADPALMQALFDSMFRVPLAMERVSGESSAGWQSFVALVLEKEIAFSFVLEDQSRLHWIVGSDGSLALIADEQVYLSSACAFDYSSVAPHLSWLVVTRRDQDGRRYDVSADGKTFLYYYSDNPSGDFMIPEGIEVVAENSFRAATNVKALSFASSVKTIEGNFFYDSCFERVIIPETVENVRYDFYNCKNLKELICAAPMTMLYGVRALPALETLVLPSTLTEFELWTFDGGLPLLKEIRTYGADPLRDEAFEAFCEGTVYYLPEGVKELSIDQLIGLGGDIYLPDSCKTFYASPGVYLAGEIYTISVAADTVVVSDGHAAGNVRIWRRGTESREGRVTLEDAQGNRYDLTSDGLSFLYYHAENVGRAFTVPRGVQGVRTGAFVDIPCLKELSFANTVQGIGDIFYEGIPLEYLSIPSSIYQYENSSFEIHTPTLKHLSVYCEVGGVDVAGCVALEFLSLKNLPEDFDKENDLRGCDSLHWVYVDGERVELE